MPSVRWKDNPKEYFRQYYLENKLKYYARSRAWAKAHPDKAVAATRKWKFGLTPAQQRELLSKPCAICEEKATHIDHDHRTGKVRAGLCNNCNTGLGMFKDDPAVVRKACDYLGG